MKMSTRVLSAGCGFGIMRCNVFCLAYKPNSGNTITSRLSNLNHCSTLETVPNLCSVLGQVSMTLNVRTVNLTYLVVEPVQFLVELLVLLIDVRDITLVTVCTHPLSSLL